MAETYSAGIVTAYGAAVRGGYTGTYEQFCAEQAQFGANAAQVAQDRAAVEAAAQTFTNETVPGAVQTVQQTGAAQVQAVEAASETEQQQIALAGAAQETRVTQAGDDQVDAVEEAGATQVGNVNTAGTTQVGNVNTAGTTQVGAVNTAGATQVQAVEDKGQEVIDSIPEDYTDLTEDVADLKSITTKTESEIVEVSLSLSWTPGYMVKNGTTYSGGGLQYSSRISVSSGDIISLYRSSDSGVVTSFRFITAFSSNEAIESKGSENGSFPYTVPDGVDSIVFSIGAALNNVYGIKKSTVNTTVPTLKSFVANNNPNRFLYKFDVTNNNPFESIQQPQDMCGYRICFYCKITTITNIVKIGKGIGLTYGGGVGFDGTNLYQYFSTNDTPVRTQPHSLTLKDYVSVIIDVGYDGKANVMISTNGGLFKWEIPYWRAYYGALSVSSSGTLYGCELSYACAALNEQVWVYGDSYIEYLSNSRWTYYLVNSGHTKYLLNGFPGRNSVQALQALNRDLQLNRLPKKIVWCLGMNDKDTNGEPNENWLSSLHSVMEICETNYIELVLATIPNVPSSNANNVYKNEYVTTSGYRYIDFANAVSADGSSTWYDNMLNSDNVHPDVQGAIALYNCAVTEVPELLF